MVCLVGPVLKKKEKLENSSGEMNTEEIVFDENFDDEYSLVRLAGGSIIGHPPLFTPNGKYLLIIYQQKVLMYSTSTGEWIKDFEEFGKNQLLSIEFLLNDSKTLIGCSTKGDIVFWDCKNGSILKRLKLSINGILKTFTLLNIPNGLFSLITYRDMENNLKYDIVNIERNSSLNCPLNFKLDSNNDDVMAVAETNFFHYFVIAQRERLIVIDYRSWKYRLLRNAHMGKITVVKAHPSELLLATGDENGKIFLYRDIFKLDGYCKSTLYAWHHTPVTSIEFTFSGSGFYSGGYEAVLVKWNINRSHMREYLPRMAGHICHIVVGDKNRKVAVCTADNGIQILDDQHKQISVLQNFTFVYDNKCEQNKLPVGLVLNPINNSLVLNGRYGHLQFFSTHTKSLLYNIDIVMNNKLSTERNKILYDTIVTTAAFSVGWMATGEVWDDQEHLPELRLKFWEYKNENQSYSLNTSIELPHEGGIKVIKFANAHSADNLLCATLGNDDYIKIWSLETIDGVRKKRKIWLCISKTKYKDYKGSSIDFSSDSSLLAVGYGNTLCIFKTDDLKLKAALTAPSAYDGSSQKVELHCHEKNSESLIKMNSKYKNIIDIFKNFEEDAGDKGIIKILENSSLKSKTKISTSSALIQNKNSAILFKKILEISELNLFQKFIIFQKLNIHFSVSSSMQSKVLQYLNTKLNKEAKEKRLRNYTIIVNPKYKFKAKYRLRKYYSRKNMYQSKVNETLIPLLDMLKIEDNHNSTEIEKPSCNGFLNNTVVNNEEFKRKRVSDTKRSEHIPINLQSVPNIKIVNFGKGEFSNLVICATECRVIIWNILTLRIQFVLKLSVKEMAVDELTSLCAVFTNNKELYVFLPNAPLCLYRRSDMPQIFSACWVPRKFPKASSLNLDWQSFATLYFITEAQELVYLSSTRDEEIKDSIAFVNDPNEITRHSIFDTHSLRKVNKNLEGNFDANVQRIGVPGKTEVKSIIQMASHASAPMNRLCSNFIQSFLLNGSANNEFAKQSNLLKVSKNESDSDSETDEVYSKITQRRKIFIETLESTNKIEKVRNKKQLKKAVEEVLPNNVEF